MGDIVVKDLIKVYKTGSLEVIALRGLDCTIKGGEILAIMGPSGCGKTTLLNIIGGLDRPTAGTVDIDGMNLVDLDHAGLVRHRRERVGIVFQFFNLVPTLTARENIELPMRLAGKGSDHMKTRTDELLKLVAMETRSEHKPDEMSGGEQQRIGLAVALANDPPILLADEPTGELDTSTGHQILLLFKQLRDEFGKTVVIVTHDQRVGQIADTVMTIVDGRITGSTSGTESNAKGLSIAEPIPMTQVAGAAGTDMETLVNTTDSTTAEGEPIQREMEGLKELKKAVGAMTDMLSEMEEIRVLQENMRRSHSTREDELKLRARQRDYRVKKDMLLNLISAWDRFKEGE